LSSWVGGVYLLLTDLQARGRLPVPQYRKLVQEADPSTSAAPAVSVRRGAVPICTHLGQLQRLCTMSSIPSFLQEPQQVGDLSQGVQPCFGLPCDKSPTCCGSCKKEDPELVDHPHKSPVQFEWLVWWNTEVKISLRVRIHVVTYFNLAERWTDFRFYSKSWMGNPEVLKIVDVRAKLAQGGRGGKP
jgi:hypothetical protein